MIKAKEKLRSYKIDKVYSEGKGKVSGIHYKYYPNIHYVVTLYIDGIEHKKLDADKEAFAVYMGNNFLEFGTTRGK